MTGPRRHTTGDPALDWLLDRRDAGASESGGEDHRFRVLNNSRAASRPYYLYGRDADGIVQKATATNGPKWLCLETVAPGTKFLAATVGEVYAAPEDASTTFTLGGVAYLSGTLAGTVTGTPPSGTVWRVGTFLATRAGRNGTIKLDLSIDSEPTGSAGGV